MAGTAIPVQSLVGLLEIPAVLAAGNFRLRLETPGDYSFLERLYMSVREYELRPVDWPEAAKMEFLAGQFRLQYRHYAEHYRGSTFSVLERAGVPVGRLYVFRGETDVRIVDVSLLPEVRNAGVGGALLRAVLAEAADAGKTVSIHVEKFNPARRLYRRLGFCEVGDRGPYSLMEARPVAEV